MQIDKKDEENVNIEPDNLSVQDVADESANKPDDETLRQVLRGDESKGDADKRDIVGSSKTIDTPQGREEAKKDKGRDS